MQNGKIIEPLAELYKDEVRQVGEILGLPEEMVWRHPFPGPGLAVRCLCTNKEDYPINREPLEKNINHTLEVTGLKAALLPLNSVGVQGDFRTYRHPLAIVGETTFDQLDVIATQLINQNTEINRVLWMLEPRKIKKMFIYNSYLTPERVQLLQQADDVVNNFIKENELIRKIWQFPVVLIPLTINARGGESIVLRPVESEEAMTANFYHMDTDLLNRLAHEVMRIKGITAVFYDVTNKPPGTIEWE